MQDFCSTERLSTAVLNFQRSVFRTSITSCTSMTWFICIFFPEKYTPAVDAGGQLSLQADLLSL
jgi:hypothetical protein